MYFITPFLQKHSIKNDKKFSLCILIGNGCGVIQWVGGGCLEKGINMWTNVSA